MNYSRLAIITLLSSIFSFAFLAHAGQPASSRQDIPSDKELQSRIQRAWEVSMERFFHRDTKLFYEYITSYAKGQWLAHLPTSEEIGRQYPNVYGYGTGMEDCMISAGVMLDMIVDRYAVTGESGLKRVANDVFEGVYRTATAPGTNGFLPRGLSPKGGKSYYIGSSRDQYTHAVHGLWVYYNSPLSKGPARKKIAKVLTGIADRMRENVTPENDYNALMANGEPDPRGIQKMWEVKAHEAARLPLVYAAAWVASGQQKYYDYYREYIGPAVEQSFAIEDQTPTYSFLQMQSCLELLYGIETDEKLKTQMREVMKDVAARAARRAIPAGALAESLDLSLLPTDWRTGDAIASGSLARKVWYNPRESGEAALTQIIDGCQSFDETQKQLLRKAILRIDYDRIASGGIFYLQGAYWKAKRYGCL